MELRPYQNTFVADFSTHVSAGKRRIIGVAPTGSGKTVIAAAIIKQHIANYKDVLVLAAGSGHD